MSRQPSKQQKTKICTACGIRKPLSDFVIDPSKRLKEYSDICQSCRGTKHKETVDDDEGGGGKIKQLGIDYFAKRFMEELHEKWLEKQSEQTEKDTLSPEEKSEEEKAEKKTEESIEKTAVPQPEKSEPNDGIKSTFSSKISTATFSAFGFSTETKFASRLTSTFGADTENIPAKQAATETNKAETEKIKTAEKQLQDQKNQTITTIVEKENSTSTLFQKAQNIITKAAGVNTPAGTAEVNRHTKIVERYFKAPPPTQIFKTQTPEIPKEKVAPKTEAQVIKPVKK